MTTSVVRTSANWARRLRCTQTSAAAVPTKWSPRYGDPEDGRETAYALRPALECLLAEQMERALERDNVRGVQARRIEIDAAEAAHDLVHDVQQHESSDLPCAAMRAGDDGARHTPIFPVAPMSMRWCEPVSEGAAYRTPPAENPMRSAVGREGCPLRVAQEREHGEHAPVIVRLDVRSSFVKMLVTCFSTAR